MCSSSTNDPPYCCYILIHCPGGHRTYCGSTNNLKRRLRQHNGELKGGARYTTKFGKQCWKLLASVSGFHGRSQALSFEWAMKHSRTARRRGTPLDTRVTQLQTVIAEGRWWKRYPPEPTALTIHWTDESSWTSVSAALSSSSVQVVLLSSSMTPSS